jgi:hypothetical protein
MVQPRRFAVKRPGIRARSCPLEERCDRPRWLVLAEKVGDGLLPVRATLQKIVVCVSVADSSLRGVQEMDYD